MFEHDPVGVVEDLGLVAELDRLADAAFDDRAGVGVVQADQPAGPVRHPAGKAGVEVDPEGLDEHRVVPAVGPPPAPARRPGSLPTVTAGGGDPQHQRSNLLRYKGSSGFFVIRPSKQPNLLLKLAAQRPFEGEFYTSS
jgi:hypothetical protein